MEDRGCYNCKYAIKNTTSGVLCNHVVDNELLRCSDLIGVKERLIFWEETEENQEQRIIEKSW